LVTVEFQRGKAAASVRMVQTAVAGALIVTFTKHPIENGWRTCE
jgi:hypothetical protein